MTQSGLESALKELKWTKAELARRVHVTRTTVSRWDVVPGPVVAYLELYMRVKRALAADILE